MINKKRDLFNELSEYYPFTPEQLEKIVSNQMTPDTNMKSSTLNYEMLRNKYTEGYVTWFERWWISEDMEKTLINDAKAGYSGYKITVRSSCGGMSDKEIHQARRKNAPEFIGCLKEKLPGFTIKKEELKTLMGKNAGYNIYISWRDVQKIEEE